MECKSIQSISSSSSRRSYDVFVSFRGEDTRNNFTNHLFAAFRRKGIVAFRDDTNLKQGEHISTELIQAIEGSRVLVVVFSKNYANSSWCLQELAKILDCMKVTGQSVLPVFYDVSPSEVRKQNGGYGKAFSEHEERFKQDLRIVQTWREALKEVADLSGWDVQNKPENEEIEKIVERVNNILGYKSSSLDGLVGIYPRLEQLEKLLAFESNDDVRVVGICGMGGIGKTTLARALYDRNFHQYGACCFIDDMSKIYAKDGPIAAQKQLICQTLQENRVIYSVPDATRLIRTRLCFLKTLIVLDNVDKVEQLQKLGVNRDCLSAGSRVIIISRDRHILNEYGMDAIYDAQLLNMHEARQLFYRKAFKHNYIMSFEDHCREYEKLTDLAIGYAQHLPLAIEVLGSFLCGRSISEWRSALARLKDNPNREIMDVLHISFDGLEQEEKEIFLEIACLFEDEDERYVKRTLDSCGFHSDIGIRVLIDKSLITIPYSRIIMHKQLQELGMKIVKRDGPNEPWKWSRIWRWEDFDRMSEKMAMDNVKTISMRFGSLEVEQTTSRAEVLSRMYQLRLLVLVGAFTHSSEDLNYLSSELRVLHWDGYPFTYFPANWEMSKLVELHLPYSSIKQLWEGKKALYNLKIMDLFHSKCLVSIPDISLAPNLEWLNLKACSKLVHIHPSIGLLRKLAYLNLKSCTSLQSLPNTIFDVSSLKTVNLQGCSILFQSTSDIAIQCQSIFSAVKMLMLPLDWFNFRRHSDKFGSVTPSDLAHFTMLRKLDLSYCKLVDIPVAMASLYCLEVLYLAGNNFVKLPCVIKELPRLIRLNLDHCKQLTSLFDEFPLCTSLPVPKEFVYKKNKKSRARLHIFNCPKLVGMEGWSSIALSWMIKCLKVNKETSSAITVVIPGTQIPSWFSCQCMGDEMDMELFPYVRDCNSIGLVMCAAFVTECTPNNRIMKIGCTVRFGFEDLCVVKSAKTYGFMFESSVHHLCFFYLSQQELITSIFFSSAAKYPLVLKFCVYFEGPPKTPTACPYEGWEESFVDVRRCGMRNVFKQDLEEHNGDE